MAKKKTSAEMAREQTELAKVEGMLGDAFGMMGGLEQPPEEMLAVEEKGSAESEDSAETDKPEIVELENIQTDQEVSENTDKEDVVQSEAAIGDEELELTDDESKNKPPADLPSKKPPSKLPADLSSKGSPSKPPAGPPSKGPPSKPPAGPPSKGPPSKPPAGPPSKGPPSKPPAGPPSKEPPSKPPAASKIKSEKNNPDEASENSEVVGLEDNDELEDSKISEETDKDDLIQSEAVTGDNELEPSETDDVDISNDLKILPELTVDENVGGSLPNGENLIDESAENQDAEDLLEKEAEIARLEAEVERLRSSMAGAADIIEELESTPMPPIVTEDLVIGAHIVADMARMARQLDRDELVRASMGSIAMLHPDRLEVLISTKHSAMLPRMNERDICAAKLGGEAPRGSPDDWRILEVLLASASLVTGGPAAVIHSFGPYTTAISCEKDLVLMQPIDEIGKEYIGKIIVVDPDPENPEEFLRQVAEALQQGGMRCVVIRGSGAYAVGADLDQAWANAAMLEHSMKVVMLARQANLKV